MKKHTSSGRNILIGLLAILGLSALGGGGALILSPSGKLIGGLPLAMLQNSPFTDFFVPGIILFMVLGVAPLSLIISLLKKNELKFFDWVNCFNDMHWAWTFSIYIAFALIIWIQTEMLMISSIHWSHALYTGLAVLIIFVALLPQVRNLYRKSNHYTP
ncbi:MAG: hypothetical protein ABI203_01180 [Mucilaginibacter sp.]